MTLPPGHSHPWPVSVLRGAAAFVTLGGVLVGVPAVLLATGYVPHVGQGDWQILAGLRPDWGAVFFLRTVLPSVAWVAWLFVAIPWLIEVTALVLHRERRAGSGPFRAQQLVAALLLGAVISGLAATRIGGPDAAAQPRGETASPPVVLVAADHLGARASEVRGGSPSVRSYRVRVGDTLWGVADRFLGTGTAYPRIARASAPVRQPDGKHLTDPDRILPGWSLTIPTRDLPHPTTDQERTPWRVTPNRTAASPHASVAPARPSPVTATTAAVPRSVTPGLDDGGPTGVTQTVPAAPTAEPEDPTSQIAWEPAGATLFGLLAAGLVSFIAVRRLRRRRNRAAHSGREIPTVPPPPATVELEQRIRAIDDPLNAVHLHQALQALGPLLAATDPPAQLAAVRGESTRFTFYFDTPVRLPAPFREDHADGTTWTVETTALHPSDPADSASVLYPALVTLGTDASGAMLLLNLEPIGTLRITAGDPDLARGVLTAIMLELATNAWSRDVTITTIREYGQLAAHINSARIRILETEHDAHRLVEAEMTDRRRAMDADGIRDVLTARTADPTDEIRGPHILITSSATPPQPHQETQPESLTDRGTGLVTILVGPQPPHGDSSARLEISAADRAEYVTDGQTLAFIPQRIGPAVEALLGPLFAGRPDEDTDDDAAALSTTKRAALIDSVDAYGPSTEPERSEEPAAATEASPAPYLRLLGPVDAIGLPPNVVMPRRTIEFLTYLHTHAQPVASDHVQAALWPDVYDPRRNNARTLARHVRSALGIAADGELLLPEGQRGLGFTTHPSIRSDWSDFQHLTGTDLAASDDESLATALRLVRGAPFAGAPGHRGWWTWRGPLEEQIIERVLDVADELAHRALQGSDHSTVRFAAHVAKAIDPLNEAGWRIELQLAIATADVDGFDRVLDDLYAHLGSHVPGYTLDDATQTIVDHAAHHRGHQARGRP